MSNNDDQIVTYERDLPHPELQSAEWHRAAQMVFTLIAAGRWADLRDNAQATVDQGQPNEGTIAIAEMLLVLQEFLRDEYSENRKEELEELKNVVAKHGPFGTVSIFW